MRARRASIGLVTAVAGVALVAPAGAGAGTITVAAGVAETNNGDGLCGFREAVQATNINAAVNECPDPGTSTDLDTIVVPAGTYTIAVLDTGSDDNVDGDFDIVPGMGLTIDGAGSATTTFDGDDKGRLFHQLSGALTVRDATLTDGTATGALARGGAILINPGPGGSLLVQNSLITANVAPEAGGGIGGFTANATIRVETSTISDNDANNTTSTAGGGGILSQGSLTVRSSTITGNDGNGGASGGDGGGIDHTGSLLEIVDSEISSNHAFGADAVGGGINLGSGAVGSKSITGSRITGNTSDHFGGGLFSSLPPGDELTITDSLVSGNSTDTNGGGIFNQLREMTLTDVRVHDNTAAELGGGIQNQGTLHVSDSAVTLNKVIAAGDVGLFGGGISSSGVSVDVRGSTVAGNTLQSGAAGSESGAGIAALAGAMDLINSTVSENGAVSDATPGFGGGIYSRDSDLELLHTTVAANDADGEGDGVYHEPGTGEVRFRNSIVEAPDSGDVCDGVLISDGFNTSNAAAAQCNLVAGGDAGSAPALLGDLADNGGKFGGPAGAEARIQTHSPGAGSPAIDRVPVGNCVETGPVTTDERGFPRPAGSACDSGAYERWDCLGADATNLALIGASAAEKLIGTTGSDVLIGLGGNDTLDGRSGADRICGGEGTDTASFASGGKVTAKLAAGTATGQGSDLLEAIENLTGSPKRDLLVGNALANLIEGGKGNDTLNGKGGKDELRGQKGRDKLKGGGGRDLCNGGPGRDRRAAGCERRRKLP